MRDFRRILRCCACILLACELVASLVNVRFVPVRFRAKKKTTVATSSSSSSTTTTTTLSAKNAFDEFQRNEEVQRRVLEAVAESNGRLEEVHLVGRSTLRRGSNNGTVPCLVLTRRPRDVPSKNMTSSPSYSLSLSSSFPMASRALCVPITQGQLKLLSVAVRKERVSKSLLVSTWNPLLVNRDDGLFDNLPWSRWTIDPQRRNRDAADNPISEKIHLGKRDAYNVMMGKDWKGRALNLGNLALRLKYSLEEWAKQSDGEDRDENRGVDDEVESMSDFSILTKRIADLQLRELASEIAECEYELAVARQRLQSVPADDAGVDVDDDVDDAEEAVRTWEIRLQSCQNRFAFLNDSPDVVTLSEQTTSSPAPLSILTSVLDRIADQSTSGGANAPPYRGANGYAPKLDTVEDVERSILPYSSPFDLLREIIEEQLNARVIGCVLENTSLLADTLAVGGAIVLERKAPETEVVVEGRVIGTVRDEKETFGNKGVRGGAVVLVECDVDEAIGMALASQTKLHVEKDVWDRSNFLMTPEETTEGEDGGGGGSGSGGEGSGTGRRRSVYEILPVWRTQQEDVSLLLEGQDANQSVTSQVSPLRIPMTTMTLYEAIMNPSPYPRSTTSQSSFFPTDNPIQSLAEYDELSNSGKARLLLSLSNFNGKLPRPRVLRKFERDSKRAAAAAAAANQERGGGKGTAGPTAETPMMATTNPLDDLLLPLIDESVRRQYMIRDAVNRRDDDALRQLESRKSRRQETLELAELAREIGDEWEAERLQNEANLYGSLRADVTQDEGSYSRFLDKDEWYERDRRALVSRTNRSRFGTLLDGIE